MNAWILVSGDGREYSTIFYYGAKVRGRQYWLRVNSNLPPMYFSSYQKAEDYRTVLLKGPYDTIVAMASRPMSFDEFSILLIMTL